MYYEFSVAYIYFCIVKSETYGLKRNDCARSPLMSSYNIIRSGSDVYHLVPSGVLPIPTRKAPAVWLEPLE